MREQPQQGLVEQAADKIEAAFPAATPDGARVIWWDDGGYLRDIIKSATQELDIGFRAAEGFPLELRAQAAREEESDQPAVWYVAEAKGGRDWFRDIRETGGEITCAIEDLTAELYEVNPWDIFDRERHDQSARDAAADIIRDRFSSGGFPQYNDLIEAILTKGEGQLLDHLLIGGWPEIERDPDTVAEVRRRLRNTYNIPIESGSEPATITKTARRWAVAEALVEAGVPATAFPAGYGDGTYNPLGDILRLHGSPELAENYLGEQYWPDIIADLDESWVYASCRVEGALDVALWDDWTSALADGEFETCIAQASERHDALSVYPERTGWVSLWNQATHLAHLQRYFTEWDARSDDADPFSVYADAETGSWRIDNEVLQLQLTRNPESDLPHTHPATEGLPPLRDELLTDRYRTYLETLAADVRASVQVSPQFGDKDAAYKWWNDYEDEFDELGTVAVLFIDALRFDLAQRLASQLEDEFDVRHDTRFATLPTETKFGMAALTPGRAYRFNVSMEDGELTVERGDLSLGTKNNRKTLLDQEGWAVPDSRESGWEANQIAYYDKEIDDVGEGEVGDIEQHFRDYIDDLSALVRRKLEDEQWDAVYVVTDHGFVLLPESTTMEAVSAEYPDSETKYRRVAGDAVDEAGPGVLLEPNTPGLEYLDTNLQMLINPRQHFSKQGYTTQRYYHGGLLPQECMLSFLKFQ